MLPVYGGGEASDGVSKVNRAEVEAVAAVVHGLRAAGLCASDIGVVSPYAAQVRLLRSRLRAGGGSGGGGAEQGAVEVSSVDGFQGREKEVIVFSCVRASAHGGLGFLADARRVST
tara:strand:+ start:42 stop:389 length:348 start_codon:yes stop_codon:yes gene_type:complete